MYSMLYDKERLRLLLSTGLLVGVEVFHITENTSFTLPAIVFCIYKLPEAFRQRVMLYA